MKAPWKRPYSCVLSWNMTYPLCSKLSWKFLSATMSLASVDDWLEMWKFGDGKCGRLLMRKRACTALCYISFEKQDEWLRWSHVLFLCFLKVMYNTKDLVIAFSMPW